MAQCLEARSWQSVNAGAVLERRFGGEGSAIHADAARSRDRVPLWWLRQRMDKVEGSPCAGGSQRHGRVTGLTRFRVATGVSQIEGCRGHGQWLRRRGGAQLFAAVMAGMYVCMCRLWERRCGERHNRCRVGRRRAANHQGAGRVEVKAAAAAARLGASPRRMGGANRAARRGQRANDGSGSAVTASTSEGRDAGTKYTSTSTSCESISEESSAQRVECG